MNANDRSRVLEVIAALMVQNQVKTEALLKRAPSGFWDVVALELNKAKVPLRGGNPWQRSTIRDLWREWKKGQSLSQELGIAVHSVNKGIEDGDAVAESVPGPSEDEAVTGREDMLSLTDGDTVGHRSEETPVSKIIEEDISAVIHSMSPTYTEQETGPNEDTQNTESSDDGAEERYTVIQCPTPREGEREGHGVSFADTVCQRLTVVKANVRPQSNSAVDTDIRRESPVLTPQRIELSDPEIIARAKEILMNDVFVAERPTTAKGRQSTLQTTPVTMRCPNDLLSQLDALGGRRSNHMEMALRLYAKLMKKPNPEE